LHGDIHHENILDFGSRGWLAIDPKRVYGERGFDFANIFCNPELPTVTKPGRLQRQLPIVCAEAGLEPKRLLRWIIAYAGLSAAWFLSDGDTKNADSDFTVAGIAFAELNA
jgi:streptomycin 6-kinase